MLQLNITNIRGVQSRLKKTASPEQIKEALIKLGFSIEATAKRRCPVDTGRLRASISTNWDGSGMGRGKVESPAKGDDGISEPKKGSGEIAVVSVGTNVEYAMYIEYGTRKMPPKPFLENSAREEVKAFKSELENIIALKKMF